LADSLRGANWPGSEKARYQDDAAVECIKNVLEYYIEWAKK